VRSSATPSGASLLINVAIAVDTRLLHDVLVDLLASHPGIQVTECLVPPSGAPELPEAVPPDVVIISSPHPGDDAVPIRLLHSAPRCRVLALASNARRAFLYELRPHRTALGELSRETLIAAVHGPATGVP
jgi:DNA-binding NarL/FixJ family response regulator